MGPLGRGWNLIAKAAEYSGLLNARSTSVAMSMLVRCVCGGGGNEKGIGSDLGSCIIHVNSRVPEGNSRLLRMHGYSSEKEFFFPEYSEANRLRVSMEETQL